MVQPTLAGTRDNRFRAESCTSIINNKALPCPKIGGPKIHTFRVAGETAAITLVFDFT
jgi:hypothetical protein